MDLTQRLTNLREEVRNTEPSEIDGAFKFKVVDEINLIKRATRASMGLNPGMVKEIFDSLAAIERILITKDPDLGHNMH